MSAPRAADAGPQRRRGRWSLAFGLLAVPAIVLILAAVIVVPQIVVQARNDAVAHEVETALLDTPLPADAELVDSMSVAGKLSGNGNGMQYLGVLLIRSDETLSELQTFYSAQSLDNAPSIEVATPESLNGLHKTPGFLGETGEPRTFIVYAWGMDPGWPFSDSDLRGH